MPSTRTYVYDTITEILHVVAKVPAELIGMDKRIEEDLDIDSLSMVEICVTAEKRLGVSLPDEHAAAFVTVADLVEYVDAALAAASG